MLVVEAILLGVVVSGALFYVLGYDAPVSDTAVAANDVEIAADDALRILVGLRACDGLAGGELAACDDAFGGSLLTRLVTEALVGEPKNLTLKMRTLSPVGVRWNLWLSNGIDHHKLAFNMTPPGEAATSSVNFAPEWNHTAMVTDRARYGGAGGAANPMVVTGLPVWKSFATALAAADSREVRFAGGAKVHLENVTVDGDRRNASSVGWWNFNEGAGLAIDNASREPAAQLALNLPARWVEGRRGPGIAFAAAYPALVSSHVGLRAPEVSLLVWARPASLPTLNDVRVVEYTPDAGGAETVAIRIGTDGKAYAHWTDGVDARTARAPAPLATATWTQLTATYGDGALRLYVGGALAAETSAPGSFGVAATPAVRIGGMIEVTDANAFEGRLDEVRVYSRVLAEDEFSLARSGYSTTWNAASGATGVASRLARGAETLTGSALYRPGGVAAVTLSRALMQGVNNSTVAAGASGSFARTVPLDTTAAVEYDFRPVLRRLAEEGVAFTDVAPGVRARTTITVWSPVSQIPGSNEKHHPVYNATFDGAAGTATVWIPRTALPGSHVVVASLNLTVTAGGSTEGLLVRKMDYVDVVNPAVGPASPMYRLIAEMWLPEWR